MSCPAIRWAANEDIEEIEGLLKEASLPVAGVREHLQYFLIARIDGAIVGAVGLELYEKDGLLRSLVVRKSARSQGIGDSLYRRLLDEARHSGVQRLILLTTTAESYFAARGFRRIDRNTIKGGLTRSAEFTGVCPDSAVCLELTL